MLQLIMYKLPELNFSFDQFEPFIDTKTMEIHYTKHHQGYVDKLNETLKDYPQFSSLTIEDLLSKVGELPSEIKQKVTNFGGGHYNHTFFWQILTKKLPSNFSSFEEEFKQKGVSLFGSGWVWLVENGDSFEVMTTANQDSPLLQNKKPVLGLDLWEHAYYLKYQNRRAEYIDSFLKIFESR
ncbi:MAG: superoxide dismutase [bacterium]|nr:MAG: superoxide dismutase [bacterium]